MGPKLRGRLVEQARRRIARWLAGNAAIDQTTLARAVNHRQSWVSQYLAGRQQADIDELDAMARCLGHSLTELLDCRENPQEQYLLDLYRALSMAEHRRLAREFLEAMQAPARPARRTRIDEARLDDVG